MAKLTLTDVTSGYQSPSTINSNNAATELALENTLSRDGTGPNTMSAQLDMNSQRILNLPDAVANQEPITLSQAATIASVDVSLTQENVAAVLWPATAAETAASVTPTNLYYRPYDLPRYGAAIDGGTDDGTAVRNWLLASIQAGVPATSSVGGTALCTTFTAIDTTSPVYIIAPGLTIKGPAGATDFCRPGGDLYSDGVVYDRWSSVFERETADTGSITRFIVKNNTFQNCTGLVINIERPIEEFWICDNKFSSNTGGYNVRIGTNTYASQDNWQKGWINRNNFDTLTAASTTSLAAIIAYGKWVEISGNTIDDLNQTGTGECWGIYTKCRNVRITNNMVNNIVADGSTDNSGINIKGDVRGGTTTVQGYGSICIGNNVSNIGINASQGSGIAARSDDLIVSGNYIEAPGLFGINADVTSDTYNNIVITSNTVYYSAATSTTRGISITGEGSNVIVSSNNVHKAYRGYSVIAGTTTLDDVSLANNHSEACTHGIVIGASTSGTLDTLSITGHRFVGTHTIGIVNGGFGGTLSSVIIDGNDLRTATTKYSGTEGTTHVVTNNLGYGYIDTFTSTDATPSVLGGSAFLTAGTTAITDFDDGVIGQTIHILATASITITDGAPIILNGSVDYTMTDTDTLTLTMFNDQVWQEVGRSVN